MQKFTVDDILNKKQKCLGNKKRCGVYKITNVINNKIYIGSSKSILQRWRNHITELETGRHHNIFLQEAWCEYGKDNFVFEILEECNEDQRYIIEQKYLDTYFPFYRSDNGYNIAEISTQRNEIRVRLFNAANGDNYYIVKAKGCKPHVMDKDHCNTTPREILEEECHALDAYSQIRKDVIEQCGDDDWEW